MREATLNAALLQHNGPIIARPDRGGITREATCTREQQAGQASGGRLRGWPRMIEPLLPFPPVSGATAGTRQPVAIARGEKEDLTTTAILADNLVERDGAQYTGLSGHRQLSGENLKAALQGPSPPAHWRHCARPDAQPLVVTLSQPGHCASSEQPTGALAVGLPLGRPAHILGRTLSRPAAQSPPSEQLSADTCRQANSTELIDTD